MQWVVTTGRSVEEAKERALDALGIDEDDLEFEVVAEPSSSLFGLRTTEASVRARVRPTRPRPKVDRRNRRHKRDGRRRRNTNRSGRSKSDRGREGGKPKGAPAKKDPTPPASEAGAPTDPAATDPAPKSPAPKNPAPKGSASPAEPERRPAAPPSPAPDTTDEETPTRSSGSRGEAMSDIPLTDQGPTAVGFVEGLVEAFGAEASVEAEHLAEDEAIEIRVEGEDLGLLVGQRGTTLASITELTRTAVAQQHSGRLEGRLRVDVAGYRARRKEALQRFVAQVADKVLETGAAVALEPMSPPDRKIVHDAANEIDGIHTSSRGEDRRRHVVIHPDD